MPNQRGLWCVLSVVTLLSTVAHATPWSLTDASIQMDATKALDTPISQLWSERNDLVAQMAQAGLVDPHTGHDHDHDNGMGGNFEPEIGALSSDSIEYTINELSEQAQRRQDSLDRLAESLTYRQSGDPVNISRLLAVEPVANARLTSSYGYRTMGGRGEFHPGVDLAAPYGTPIYSTGAGVVCIRVGCAAMAILSKSIMAMATKPVMVIHRAYWSRWVMTFAKINKLRWWDVRGVVPARICTTRLCVKANAKTRRCTWRLHPNVTNKRDPLQKPEAMLRVFLW